MKITPAQRDIVVALLDDARDILQYRIDEYEPMANEKADYNE